LVKKVPSSIETFQCEKCGNTYSSMEEALRCESNPISPFKYQIGDTVIFEFKSRLTGKILLIAGIIEDRWIHGLSKKGEPAHGNVYKIRIIKEGAGLIACRFEDQIIRKV